MVVTLACLLSSSPRDRLVMPCAFCGRVFFSEALLSDALLDERRFEPFDPGFPSDALVPVPVPELLPRADNAAVLGDSCWFDLCRPSSTVERITSDASS